MHVRVAAVAAAAVAITSTAVAIVTAAPAQAVICTNTWTGPAGGNWTTAANWSTGAVPTHETHVCIDDVTGPTVAAGDAAEAHGVHLHQSSLRVDGSLTALAVTVVNGELGGSGTITSTGDGGAGQGDTTMNDAMISGSVHLVFAYATLSGQPTSMCGAMLTFCLADSSQLTVQHQLAVNGSIVGGDTTAEPAISAADMTISRSSVTNRIGVSYAGGVSATGSGSTLRLDQWRNLTAAGSLTAAGGIDPGANVVTVARSVLTLNSTVDLRRGALQTADGADALSRLKVLGARAAGDLALPADVTPAGGTLTVQRGANVRFTAATTVHGNLSNSGRLTGVVGVTCAEVTGKLTMASAAQLQLVLNAPDAGCPALYTATGSATLPGTLTLRTPHRLAVGTRIVLVDATGGVTNTFTTINGQNAPGGRHWEISYTATRVTATLVAGNV